MSRAIKKVLIAEDHNIVRRGLRTLLDTHPNLEIVAETANGREALDAARTTSPDIAILDYSMPELNGLDLTIELRKLLPGIEVLMYTMHESEDTVLQAFQAGVRGYVLKSDSERSLLAGIDAISSHRTYFSGTICEALLADFMRNRAKTAPSALAAHREREVVQLIAEGKLNKQVGHILGISIKTVETHRASAMQKLNISSSAELIRYAVRNKMVEP